ncbi:MAG: DUF2842 domain-containing protein [Pseudomonadota bacterium]
MKERPNWRNLVGTLALLFGLALYGLIIAELSVQVGSLPFLVEVVFYIIAGLIWLWPARALVRWMLAGNLEK